MGADTATEVGTVAENGTERDMRANVVRRAEEILTNRSHIIYIRNRSFCSNLCSSININIPRVVIEPGLRKVWPTRTRRGSMQGPDAYVLQCFFPSIGSIESLPSTFESGLPPPPTQLAPALPEAPAPSDALDTKNTSASEWGSIAPANESCKNNNSIENVCVSTQRIHSTKGQFDK